MENNIKIVIFGDSVTKGIITDNGKIEKTTNNFVDLISGHFNFEIQNLSSYGQTIKRLSEKNTIEEYVENIDKTKQNIAVFALGGNDSDYNWKEVEKEPTFEHSCKVPVDEFSSLLKQKIKILKESGVAVVMLSLPPISSDQYLNNVIAKIVAKEKILEFFLGDTSNIYRHQELFNDVVCDVAFSEGCLFLDYRKAILIRRNYLCLLCKDGVHPNEEGHKFIAEELIKQIEKIKRH